MLRYKANIFMKMQFLYGSLKAELRNLLSFPNPFFSLLPEGIPVAFPLAHTASE